MDEIYPLVLPLVLLAGAVVLWAIGRGLDRFLRRSGLSEGWKLFVLVLVLLPAALLLCVVMYLFSGNS